MTKTDLILHLKTTELKLLVPVQLLCAQGAGPQTPASHSPGAVSPGLYPPVSLFHMLTPVPPAPWYK